MAVTKDMLIREVLQENPNSAEILMSFGLGCIGCPSAQMETLEEAAAVHGVNVDNIVEALTK
ncbi:MAG TPA: disulfide oxidoreductase [Clostridiales bacterium]|nr:disulfide oxidoreductase [Clostridiales bacterium]